MYARMHVCMQTNQRDQTKKEKYIHDVIETRRGCFHCTYYDPASIEQKVR